jgi:hypothetical protein
MVEFTDDARAEIVTAAVAAAAGGETVTTLTQGMFDLPVAHERNRDWSDPSCPQDL